MFTTLDKFGRVIIPKKLREHLAITPETTLNIVEDGDRIIIEPLKENEPIVEKDGLLVFTGKLKGDINQFIVSDRRERMNKMLFPRD